MSIEQNKSGAEAAEKKPADDVPLEKEEIEALKAYSMGMCVVDGSLHLYLQVRMQYHARRRRRR